MIYLRGDAQKPLGGLYLRSQASKEGTPGTVNASAALAGVPGVMSAAADFDDGTTESRIIDHTNFDPASRTLGEIQAAAALDIYLEHASTGEDIVGDSDADSSTGTNFNDSQSCGMALLYAADNRFLMSRETFDYSNDYTWFASNNGLQSNMRGNPTPATKIGAFFALDANMRAAVRVALFKFCWIDVWDGSGYNGTTPGYISDGEATANSIISQTVSMESANPGLVVPLVTMPLQADESYAQRQIFNETMRAWAETNNHWLWDFADIETYSPGGVITLDGNSREVTYPSYAYVDGGHLSTTGAERLARSFWQLLISISQNLPPAPANASAALSGTAGVISATSGHTPPAFSASTALAGTPGIMAVSADHDAPTFNASAALTGTSGVIAATADHDAPVFGLSAALVGTPGTIAASGAHTPPTFSAEVALVGTPGIMAASAEHTPPNANAAATLTGTPGVMAASAGHTPPVFTASAELTSPSGVIAASAGFSPPGTVDASASLTGSAGVMAASMGFTAQPPDAVVELVGSSGGMSAEAGHTPPTFDGAASFTGTPGVMTAYVVAGTLPVPPPDRVYAVPAEARELVVAGEVRAMMIASETRVHNHAVESRAQEA